MSSGDGKKRKKNYYKSFAKKRKVGTLETDMTGFLVTYERSEFQAAKDCYDSPIFCERIARKWWRKKKKKKRCLRLSAELSELKESKDKVRRFQKVKTDVAGNFFVTTTDLKAKHEQRSRFIQRLLPVQTTCKAHLDTMKKTVETVLASYDDSASPEELVCLFVVGGEDCQAFVDGELRKPDLVLMIDVLHNICCISLMPRYLNSGSTTSWK
ncbi:hypothetical protein HPB52_025480 [Rhipicephalus sanguineus]|uniref:Uncharacterized protein n=1 Tax=Rhipicephalus sanguineus TaxID=34632 RepID=A0A9D4PB92_RHISA|nr:hypothetical protein HPB52_025480 [Rhipicephalus sanguineus]